MNGMDIRGDELVFNGVDWNRSGVAGIGV